MATLDKIEVKEGVDQKTVEAVHEVGQTYKHGWNTEIEMDYAPKGVNPDIVKLISKNNDEPQWMTDWRLQALERWERLKEPTWAMELPRNRFSGHLLLCPSKIHDRKAKISG